MPAEPGWLDLDDIRYIHDEQLELFGGEYGVLDIGLIESGLNAPRQTYNWTGEDDVLVLAVELGVSLAKNHGFVDGNKRTGVVAMVAFLNKNGFDLQMKNDRSLGRLVERVLERKMNEADLVAMLDSRVVELGQTGF